MSEARSSAEKYDRQLRLWGHEAQARLEKASVCLLSASATGCEVLKNLVLPGIGSFTVVDGMKVQAADLGNNFFVTERHIGQFRAAVVTELLQDLNSSVRGCHVEEDPVYLIESRPSFFEGFSVIIATQIPSAPLLKLSKSVESLRIPLISVRSYGLLGYLRILAPEHTIIHPHPDNPVPDLRLVKPFPSLSSFASSYGVDLGQLDSVTHSHVPFVVVLLRLANQWREQHGGQLPETREECDAFKLIVKQSSRDFSKELNFQEAYAAAHLAWMPSVIPEEVEKVFNNPHCRLDGQFADEFWLLAMALKVWDGEFVNRNGTLPLEGTIPDMTAHTEDYVQLQKLYKTQADSEAAAVGSFVEAIISRSLIDGHRRKNLQSLTADDIRRFCKSSGHLRVINFRSLEDEFATVDPRLDLFGQLDDPANCSVWYLLLLACDAFFARRNRFPGFFDTQVEADIRELKLDLASLLLSRDLSPSSIKDEVIHEMCRFGGVELLSIAGLMGGVAAQEVIKLVTHHFIPINNTFLYNGIACTSFTAEM